MKILSPLTILILISSITIISAVQCNASHFDFVGKYSLGKQDQLNTTFTKLQEKITVLPTTSYNTSETTSYSIFNAKPTFYYRDSKQRADVAGNNTIIIQGGQLEADLEFEWQRKSTTQPTITGTGTAFGLSDVIIFAKVAVIVQQGSFFSYQLQDYEDVAWSSKDPFNLTRLDPPTATDTDKASVARLLNNILQVKTVRNLLEEEIAKIYSYTLRASLHDEHMPIDNHFDYKWVPGNGKPNVTVPFKRRAVSIDIEQKGISLLFEVQADYPNWQCGNRSFSTAPLPLKESVYGSTQQFISYDFYLEVIRYAISKDLLNTDLSRQNWQSRMFQFFAGDLYQVLDKIQGRYFANAPVNGNCKASYTGLKLWKSGFDTFNVSIHFDCELNINRNKVLDFGVGIGAKIEIIPGETTADFRFRSHEEFVSFYPYADYKILNEELARLMIKHSLNRLYEGNLFGSGWPMSPPRDYPHAMAEDTYTVVYDSTHVDPHLEK